MLRFLISERQVPRGLEAAVPMPRQWALASLPPHLNKEQVSQVLAVIRTRWVLVQAGPMRICAFETEFLSIRAVRLRMAEVRRVHPFVGLAAENKPVQ
jgi:hypothetical protein